MSNKDSIEIVERFFVALDTLKKDRKIHGISNFTEAHNINRRNFYLLRKDMSRNIFQVAWLKYLSEDYGISLQWIVFGQGEMYL